MTERPEFPVTLVQHKLSKVLAELLHQAGSIQRIYFLLSKCQAMWTLLNSQTYCHKLASCLLVPLQLWHHPITYYEPTLPLPTNYYIELYYIQHLLKVALYANRKNGNVLLIHSCLLNKSCIDNFFVLIELLIAIITDLQSCNQLFN